MKLWVNVNGKNYTPILEMGQDGWVVARCEEMSGAVTQGYNLEDALRNLVEAIELMFEEEHCKNCVHFDEYGCVLRFSDLPCAYENITVTHKRRET